MIRYNGSMYSWYCDIRRLSYDLKLLIKVWGWNKWGRGLTCYQRDLAHFKSHIRKTKERIVDLETQFKLVISNVDSFLKSHKQEQVKVITRHCQKKETQEKEKDIKEVESKKVDELVVERQVGDSPEISNGTGILREKSISFLLPIKRLS